MPFEEATPIRDPKRAVLSVFLKAGIPGVIAGVFVWGVVWSYPKIINRMLAHFDVEESVSKEAAKAINATARAIEGMTVELRTLREGQASRVEPKEPRRR